MCVCISTYEDVYVSVSTYKNACVCVKICEDAREQTTLGVIPYVLSTIFWSLGFSLT